MNRENFINWLEDSSWKRQSCTYSYLKVYETYVEYTYEDKYWGGSSIETKTYSFEDFIYADENYELP